MIIMLPKGLAWYYRRRHDAAGSIHLLRILKLTPIPDDGGNHVHQLPKMAAKTIFWEKQKKHRVKENKTNN